MTSTECEICRQIPARIYPSGTLTLRRLRDEDVPGVLSRLGNKARRWRKEAGFDDLVERLAKQLHDGTLNKEDAFDAATTVAQDHVRHDRWSKLDVLLAHQDRAVRKAALLASQSRSVEALPESTLEIILDQLADPELNGIAHERLAHSGAVGRVGRSLLHLVDRMSHPDLSARTLATDLAAAHLDPKVQGHGSGTGGPFVEPRLEKLIPELRKRIPVLVEHVLNPQPVSFANLRLPRWSDRMRRVPNDTTTGDVAALILDALAAEDGQSAATAHECLKKTWNRPGAPPEKVIWPLIGSQD